jgi:hypothetical protein
MVLSNAFLLEPYPSREAKVSLARYLDVPYADIQVSPLHYFSNVRNLSFFIAQVQCANYSFSLQHWFQLARRRRRHRKQVKNQQSISPQI